MVSKSELINLTYKQEQLETFVHNIVIYSERAHKYSKRCHKHYKQITDILDAHIMDKDQTVPDRDNTSYKQIISEVNEIFDTLTNIQSAMDKIVIKIKETEKTVRGLNKVEEIIHRYNNL